MADIQDFEIPEFLKNNDEDDIQDEMLSLIPDEYDKSEGQHYWNFTRPTARIVSELRGFDLPNAIGLIWPQFSYGEYLENHADLRHMSRKEAQYATGTITFTGTPETVIPSGYICSTESKNNIPSKDYVTTKECVIGSDGTVTVDAMASLPGSDGNTASNTVVINSSAFDDITSVNNNTAFKGGIDEESDELLLGRIQDYDRTQGNSNIGNPADYKRWAESVPGTGNANVIRATDTSGIVTIILTDGNGNPASTELCNAVYNYIMSPDNEAARLAPCGANLSVLPPTTMTITVSASVELTDGTEDVIKAALSDALNEYYPEASENGEILYQKIGSILVNIDGVYDYSNLKINDSTNNIAVSKGTFPVTNISNITLTVIE